MKPSRGDALRPARNVPLGIALGLLPLASLAAAVSPSSPASLEMLSSLSPATSLLVVSPHPDDETLCCAGLIQRVLERGGRASIVWITSGDGSELDLLVIEKSLRIDPPKLRALGMQRMEESRRAAMILGVPPARQFFLGYPDRGVLALLTENFVTPFNSPYTDASSVPYSAATFPGHPYTGQSLEHDFDLLLDRVEPTLVLAPSPRDLHEDHRATALLVMRAMSRRSALPQLRYWIVHGGESWLWLSGYQPDRPAALPPRARGLAPLALQLQPAEERRKLLALRAYETQLAVMSALLLSYVRATEIFYLTPLPQSAHDRN